MLRALAALAVVVHHSLEMSNGAVGRFSPDWLTTSGASGVDIFFVISGFIMLHVSFQPHRAPPTPAGFLFRRATRIYPLYWLCCLAMLAAASAGFLRGQSWTAADAAKSLLLLPDDHLLINVSWTLVYELYFYLVFATVLIARSMAVAVIGTILAIACFWFVSDGLPGHALRSFLADPIPLEFCMGLCLAWAYSRLGETVKRPATRWALALIGLGAMAAAPLFIAHPDTSGLPGLPRVLAWGLPAVLVMVACLPIGPPRNPTTRFAVLLGDASYALYLTHVFVMIGYGWVLEVDRGWRPQPNPGGSARGGGIGRGRGRHSPGHRAPPVGGHPHRHGTRSESQDHASTRHRFERTALSQIPSSGPSTCKISNTRNKTRKIRNKPANTLMISAMISSVTTRMTAPWYCTGMSRYVRAWRRKISISPKKAQKRLEHPGGTSREGCSGLDQPGSCVPLRSDRRSMQTAQSLSRRRGHATVA